MSGAAEPLVRRELQALSARIERGVGSCWTCQQPRMTYRLRSQVGPEMLLDAGPFLVGMILDRPACLDCIAFNKSITLDEVKAALAAVADIVNVYRASDTCCVCGQFTDVLSVRHRRRDTR
jgi:hypothetical protein